MSKKQQINIRELKAKKAAMFQMVEENYESIFWLAVAESSCDFWMDPSNDVYEKML